MHSLYIHTHEHKIEHFNWYNHYSLHENNDTLCVYEAHYKHQLFIERYKYTIF